MRKKILKYRVLKIKNFSYPPRCSLPLTIFDRLHYRLSRNKELTTFVVLIESPLTPQGEYTRR